MAEIKPKIISLGHQAIKAHSRAIGECLNFGLKLSKPTKQKIEKLEKSVNRFSEKYFSYINRTLQGKARLERTPEVSTKILLDYSIKGRKPFTTTGHDGLKDFLIWQGFINTVQNYGKGHFIFISDNNSDFADAKNKTLEFHADLLGDINIHKKASQKFYYHSNLRIFLELLPDAVKNKKIISKVAEELSENQSDILNYGLFTQIEFNLPYNNSDDYEIESVSVELSEITSIKRKSPNRFSVQGFATATGEIDYYVDKHNVHLVEDQGVSVSDFDWNDHVAQCSLWLDEKFEFSMEFTEDSEDFELERIFIQGEEVFTTGKIEYT